MTNLVYILYKTLYRKASLYCALFAHDQRLRQNERTQDARDEREGCASPTRLESGDAGREGWDFARQHCGIGKLPELCIGGFRWRHRSCSGSIPARPFDASKGSVATTASGGRTRERLIKKRGWINPAPFLFIPLAGYRAPHGISLTFERLFAEQILSMQRISEHVKKLIVPKKLSATAGRPADLKTQPFRSPVRFKIFRRE